MSPQVLPPANGKKLWRVKRHVSHSRKSSDSQSSLECLNNSLKISNAAKFTMKRPPLRRPKNKPGQAKDFVFVDLSPVKSEDSDVPCTTAATTETTPVDLPQLDTSFSDEESLSSSIFDNSFSNYIQQASPESSVGSSPTMTYAQDASYDCVGLGIMGLDWAQQIDQELAAPLRKAQDPAQAALSKQLLDYQEAMLQQHQQIQYLQQQLQHAQQPAAALESSPKLHKRSRSKSEQSTKRRASGQFQFKTYTGPKNKVKKPSTPTSPSDKSVGLEDFFMLNEQLAVPLNTNDFMAQLNNYAPDYSTDYKTDLGCNIDQILTQKPEELFMGFVAI